MITKKIFLASSSELESDRVEFEIFIARKNNDLVGKNIFLQVTVWESFLGAMSPTRLQDEYNKAIRECDIFVILFSNKVGEYTEEEFEAAWGQFKAVGKPLIFTYLKDELIRAASANRKDLMSLWAFQDKLHNLGHYYTVYKNVQDLKLQFGQQLDKLAEAGALTYQIGNRVLALWEPDNYWYSGTITNINGGRFEIKYEDGQRMWLTEENIMLLGYRVDDPVECRWKGQNLYYVAHILKIDGNNITVQYDCDSSPNGPSLGEKEQTNIEMLRFKK
jgi:hypothetical protein